MKKERRGEGRTGLPTRNRDLIAALRAGRALDARQNSFPSEMGTNPGWRSP